MNGAHAVESAVIDAPPAAVYELFADYRQGHANTLPKQYFKTLEVESGGHGAGTIVRSSIGAFGFTTHYRLEVEEPVPGRLLLEADPRQQVVTTFTVDPVEDGAKSRLQIATAWNKPGIAGWIERTFNPPTARRIFRKQLRLTAEYLRTHKASPESLASDR